MKSDVKWILMILAISPLAYLLGMVGIQFKGPIGILLLLLSLGLWMTGVYALFMLGKMYPCFWKQQESCQEEVDAARKAAQEYREAERKLVNAALTMDYTEKIDGIVIPSTALLFPVEVEQGVHPKIGERLPENVGGKILWKRFYLSQIPWGSGVYLADLNTGIVYSNGTVGSNYDSSG
jgi:hypothetical protein